MATRKPLELILIGPTCIGLIPDLAINLFSIIGIDLNNHLGEIASFVVRKAAHFTEYFILYFFLYYIYIYYLKYYFYLKFYLIILFKL